MTISADEQSSGTGSNVVSVYWTDSVKEQPAVAVTVIVKTLFA